MDFTMAAVTTGLATSFLCNIFRDKTPDRCTALLTQDICCYGISEGHQLFGIDDVSALLLSEGFSFSANYSFEILSARDTSAESAVIEFSLSYRGSSSKYRLVALSSREDGGEKLCMISFCKILAAHEMKDNAQSEKRREELANSLINATLPGGVMGGYIEAGFPFYCINKKMLEYLGYETEDEFVSAVGGLIENCIAAEDRETVNSEVSRQLEEKDEYHVEYRILRRDGSSIWVHDIGHVIKAEDGRNAIISVCFDITREKEHLLLLDTLVNQANGGLGLYRLEENGALTLLTATVGTSSISGFAPERYNSRCGDNAMLLVYPDDRRGVCEAIDDALSENKVTSLNFRSRAEKGGYIWLHGMFSRYGEDGGRPVLRCVFMPSALQYELQRSALQQEQTGISVVDIETKEIYYSNDAAFRQTGREPTDYTGKKCHEIFYSESGVCEWCDREDFNSDKSAFDWTIKRGGRTLSLHSEKQTWNGRPVLVQYSQDVSERVKIQEELVHSQAVTEAACAFAGMWVFTYDIDNATVYPSESFLRQFKDHPRAVRGFPESLLRSRLVDPEYRDICRDSFGMLTHGVSSVEFEIKVHLPTAPSNWLRISASLMPDNGSGKRIASISVRIIDDEKILEARVELEKKKVLSGDKSLLGFVVTDITENRVVEQEKMRPDSPGAQLGLTLEESMERALPYISEPDREKYARLHERAYLIDSYNKGTIYFNFTGHRIHRDGTYTWVRSNMKILKNPTTGNLLLYEYVHDIHSHKMFEEIVSAAARFDYERIASVNLPAGQLTYVKYSDTDGGKYDVETASYVERMELYCMNDVCPGDRELFRANSTLENIRAGLDKTDFFEFVHRVRAPDGEIRYKRTRYTCYNRKLHICLMTRADITELMLEEETKKKRLSEALDSTQRALDEKNKLRRESNMLCAALYNIVPMVIASNLTDNTYGMMNYDEYTTKKAAYSGTYDELIAVGTSTVPENQQKLFRESFSRENMLKAYESGKREVAVEHQQYGDDGVLRWIQTRCIFVKNPDDENLYTITLSQDINKAKHQQMELQRALETAEAATLAKSEFLSRMSHEIRTPMNAIMGMTAIAKENRTDFLQIAECLDKIDMSSRFLLTLINDILEMSRIESGRTEIKREVFRFDTLMEVIHTVVEPLALRSNIRYEFVKNSETEQRYVGDVMRIQQVLVNIIGNALKFTKAGGRVRFAVAVSEQTETTTRFCFTVSDTGIGMSEEFMQKMFSPFTQEDGGNTSEYGGSGLGLAISKSLVEAMGGTIGVKSCQGVGSTFYITLPLGRVGESAPGGEAAVQTAAPDLSVLSDCQVLMAEDHPLNVTVAKKILERRGVVVTVASNGQQAVELFEKSEPGFFDAILMDIRMPVMDGLDAARAIRALPRADAVSVPIIAMTANALDEDRQNSRNAGMNAHLAKPFDPSQLYAILAQMIADNRE